MTRISAINGKTVSGLSLGPSARMIHDRIYRLLEPAIGRVRRLLAGSGGVWYALQRVVERISFGSVRLHAYYLVAQPVRDRPLLPQRRGQAIEVREIGLDEALTLPVNRPAWVIERRFRHGARCLMASSKGRFLGFLWFQLAPYDEDEVRCLFVPLPRESTAWDFDVYVDPSARLGLAFMRLWDEANRILSSQGVCWSLSRISPSNAGSLASHGRLGIRRLATTVFVSAGPAQLMLASVHPYIHMAWTRAAKPMLELQSG
jgi:hypothetical protein